ncbi:MAG: hypothetical protein ACKO5K_01805 [Armatimonadota bacterium]
MDVGVWALSALIAVFVGYFAVIQTRAVLPNLLASPSEVRAELVDVRRVEASGTGWEPAVRHIAVFRSADGGIQEFELPGERAASLTVGATGLLRTRGAWFLGFTPTA